MWLAQSWFPNIPRVVGIFREEGIFSDIGELRVRVWVGNIV